MGSDGFSKQLFLLRLSVPLRLCVSVFSRATFVWLTVMPLRTVLAKEPDRSPVDLVLGPGEAWLATVNQTSDTVSLVRVSDGSVLDEVTVGHHPIGIALLPDGKTLLVSGHYSGDVAVLEVAGGPTRSPYDPQFNPKSINRIEAIGSDISRNLNKLAKDGTRFVPPGK